MQSTKVSSRAAERLILEIRTRTCAGETYYCSCSGAQPLTHEHNNIFPIPSLYLYRRYTEEIPNKCLSKDSDTPAPLCLITNE